MDSSGEPMHAYGSTNSNPTNATHQNAIEDSDIQLNDFKGLVYTEKEDLPTVQISNEKQNEKLSAPRQTSFHTLLNRQSSCDSQSNYSESSFDHSDSWVRHPKVIENWRIVLASGFLAILGLALVATSIVLAITPQRGYHCLIIGLIGILCVIPGGYHFIYIYFAALGRPGYNFENLPVLR